MLLEHDKQYSHSGGPIIFTINVGVGSAELYIKKEANQGWVKCSDAVFTDNDVKSISMDICLFKWKLTGDATVAA
ncbi:hypothetical protein [Litoribrevibacter albus]|uniref:Uncharacterized protein n=1 Tax=Litoribrevibacter albus TaxID=1473156 RepID=A0AA37SAN1_9GAMM|nr:hypothetical protein [Litoribrevibacter albus]GLQ31651.1 hypothetical protein GCM10007876_21300 [Litoribrevibacter albus]